MGDVTRPLPTAPAPASLRAAGASGVVTIQTDNLPVFGQPDSPERWQADWQFRTPPCRPVVVGAGGCPATDTPKEWDPERPYIWQGKPFGIEAQLECSLPADQDMLAAEVRAAMERGMMPQVAQELYSGAVARENINAGNTAWDENRWLTRTDDPVLPLTVINDDDTPVPLAGGIGLLEQYLSCCSDVGRGIIHVPPAVVPPITSLGTMLAPPSTGGARFSPSGHVLVADCGYTGYGPGDTEEGPQLPADGVMWLYATGPLQVRLSTILPIDSIEQVEAFFLPDNNTVAVAPALAMYVWGCCHAAVAVDVSPYGLSLNPGS